MRNAKPVVAITALVVFGILMGYRAGMPLGWPREAVGVLAFALLGVLLVAVFAPRKQHRARHGTIMALLLA